MIADTTSAVSASLAKRLGLSLSNTDASYKKPLQTEKSAADDNLKERVAAKLRRRGATHADPAKDSLYQLISSNADWLVDRFTAILFWYETSEHKVDAFKQISDNTIDYKLDGDTAKSKAMLSKEGFCVRFGDVTVPQTTNETYEVSVGETSIQKIRSSKSAERKASFTFRLDDNLEWLDFLERGAGIKDTIEGKRTSQKDLFEYNFIRSPSDLKDGISFITRSFSLGSNTKDRRLCLAVCPDDYSPTNVLKDRRYARQYYLFEDIKLLGFESGVSYNTESTGPTDATMTFIFKRVRRFDSEGITL